MFMKQQSSATLHQIIASGIYKCFLIGKHESRKAELLGCKYLVGVNYGPLPSMVLDIVQTNVSAQEEYNNWYDIDFCFSDSIAAVKERKG